MIPGAFWSLVPMLFGLAAVQPGAVQQSISRLVIQDEVILRVPLAPRQQLPRVRWVERNGPNCIPIAAIRRAVLRGPQRVDFILANRTRVRAQFDEDCPGLDFYGDFYLQPRDNRICAGRDAIHSRMGGSCTIGQFKLLVPQIAGQ
jgi:hypothetical protein